jgi:HD domain
LVIQACIASCPHVLMCLVPWRFPSFCPGHDAAYQKIAAVMSESTRMDDDMPILRYWGKAKPKTSSGPQWHPLIYHSLDVAACGRKLLEADTERRRSLVRLSGLDEGTLLPWLSFLLAIHVFPTLVGMNRTTPRDARSSESVPHACGDEPVLPQTVKRPCACSPRLWG